MSGTPSLGRKCSFCLKPASELGALVTGHEGVAICSECVGLVRDVALDVNDPVAIANLRIAAFAALKGWGSVGNDGSWKAWDWAAIEPKAERLVIWALKSPALEPSPRPDPVQADTEAAAE